MVTITHEALTALVHDVDDPELPHVTIGDLGMVRSVAVEGEVAVVELTPTYTGCPATEQIRDDVAEAIREAGYDPDVRMVMSPAWSTDWITPRGRERLRAAGITPPPAAGEPDAPVAVAAPVPCPPLRFVAHAARHRVRCDGVQVEPRLPGVFRAVRGVQGTLT